MNYPKDISEFIVNYFSLFKENKEILNNTISFLEKKTLSKKEIYLFLFTFYHLILFLYEKNIKEDEIYDLIEDLLYKSEFETQV